MPMPKAKAKARQEVITGIKQIAAHLGLSERQLLRIRKDKTFPLRFLKITNTPYIELADLKMWRKAASSVRRQPHHT